jgi:hypothetical protein
VASKALDACASIGAQRVVRTVLEQMNKLPPGPPRVNLLYLVDSALKQQGQRRSSGADVHSQVSMSAGSKAPSVCQGPRAVLCCAAQR